MKKTVGEIGIKNSDFFATRFFYSVSSQQNMKKKFISKFFSFFAGVVDTADKHSFANSRISKFQRILDFIKEILV
jgi:hypothetical protein